MFLYKNIDILGAENGNAGRLKKLTDTIKLLEPSKTEEKPKGFFRRIFGNT